MDREKVLVTGCMGFIGSNLVANLLLAGYDVLGFDDLSNASIEPTTRIKLQAGQKWENFKFYKTDICSFESMLSICRNEGAIDYIVHLAAIGSVPRSYSHPTLYFGVNVCGFSEVVQLAKTLNVKKLVYASSSSVYGNAIGHLRVEGKEGLPKSPYALSKLFNELYAQNCGVKNIGLRFFNVYGPGQKFDDEFSAVIPQFITQKKPIVNGDGQTMRDFTFVIDVCACIMRALICEKYNFVCNVGSGLGTTLKELIDELGKQDSVTYSGKNRMGDVHQSVADVKMCRSLLGWSPTTSIKDGLKITKEFYQAINVIQM